MCTALLAGDASSQPPRPHSSPSLAPNGPSLATPVLGRPPVPRANTQSDAQGWLAPYQSRIASLAGEPALAAGVPPPPPAPWWDEQVMRPFSTTEPLFLELGALSEGALFHSSYLRAVVLEPRIRHTELVEQQAQFDWRTFLETTYNDQNDPVGNTLTTGNNDPRFKNQVWYLDSGLRRANSLGGELEAFQRLNHQDNNSRFLVPNPQSTTRLQLQYTQPLLKGAGRVYNESRIVLAQIQLNRADDEVAAELETHLLKVAESYWELYRSRAEFFQRQKLRQSAEWILEVLEGRQHVDSVQRQVLRARTALARRQSESIRAGTQIRNIEAQLRLLVNDPALVQATGREFTPREAPLRAPLTTDMASSLHTALLNRADISQAIRDVRSTAVRVRVAERDVLPRLDLLVSTYVAGLANNLNLGDSVGNQFSQGRPGYQAGLQFDMPLGRRESRAQLERQQLEMNRVLARFRLAVEEGLTRVEVAVREVDTSYRELVSRYQAMAAADEETRYLHDRWRLLPGADDSAPLLLETLLESQERLLEEESQVARAQVNYALAILRLKRELGVLLRLDRPGDPSFPAELDDTMAPPFDPATMPPPLSGQPRVPSAGAPQQASENGRAGDLAGAAGWDGAPAAVAPSAAGPTAAPAGPIFAAPPVPGAGPAPSIAPLSSARRPASTHGR